MHVPGVCVGGEVLLLNCYSLLISTQGLALSSKKDKLSNYDKINIEKLCIDSFHWIVTKIILKL